jgi:class 3 adenylate cyclase
MFGDMVGSTTLSARVDADDLREIIGARHNHIAEPRGCCGWALTVEQRSLRTSGAIASRWTRQRYGTKLRKRGLRD